MRKVHVGVAIIVAAGLLAGCGGKKGGVFAGRAPDEFAVARQQPLVIPPDFALVPPRPGTPRPQEADSSTQALQAMFGGPSPRSEAERGLATQAGAARADPGVRSTAGDPDTAVVNKGASTREIVNAPPTQGQEAQVSTAPTPR